MRPLDNSIAAMSETLAGWRHDLHRHPEMGYEEVRTAAFVAEKLRGFGLDAVATGIGGTGVVGVLHGANGAGDAAKTILVRADMDALPMDEATGAEHASTVPGRMHACGHDGHMTMLLGAARRLAETRGFDGTVIFVFQPAEEGGAGAQAMLDDGLLERFPARAVYGMHNWPGLPVGQFAVAAGPVMAAASEFRIALRGKGGHAAKPDWTHDPIIAGTALVQALQTIISRRVDPIAPAVLSITLFRAGSALNVIPETAELGGTVRSFDDAVHALIVAEIEKKCAMIGAAFDVEITFDGGQNPYPPVVNDAAETAFAGGVLDALVGPENVRHGHPPVMGAEDFAFLARVRPGAFVFIGNGDSAPLHHPEYDFDDAAAPVGVAYWTRLVEAALPKG